MNTPISKTGDLTDQLPILPTEDWVVYGRAMAIRQASKWSVGLLKAIATHLPRECQSLAAARELFVSNARHLAEQQFVSFVFDGERDIITRAEALISAVQESVQDDYILSRLSTSISENPALIKHTSLHAKLQAAEHDKSTLKMLQHNRLQFSYMSVSPESKEEDAAAMVKQALDFEKIGVKIAEIKNLITQSPWVWDSLTPTVNAQLQDVMRHASLSVDTAVNCDAVITTTLPQPSLTEWQKNRAQSEEHAPSPKFSRS